MIKSLTSDSIHQICSSQVITDLSTAVKELLENSLDAGATKVEIKLYNYGKDKIAVSDNGSGIPLSDHKLLAQKHTTSKLSSFSDLETLESFGFRGEALSSLCAMAKLIVATKTKDDKHGYELHYDSSGNLVSSQRISREIGTMITLSNLFYTLPVRLREFERTIKKEFSNLLNILQSYAIISENVQIIVSNYVSSKRAKQKQNILINTKGNGNTMKENIASVYGWNQLKTMEKIKDSNNDNENTSNENGVTLLLDDNTSVILRGWISNSLPESGRSRCDRQYFYMNGRPIDVIKISKIINNIYKQSINRNKYPILMINFIMKTNEYDINIDPNKRSIFFQNEPILCDKIDTFFQSVYQQSVMSYTVQSIDNYLTQVPSKSNNNNENENENDNSWNDDCNENENENENGNDEDCVTDSDIDIGTGQENDNENENENENSIINKSKRKQREREEIGQFEFEVESINLNQEYKEYKEFEMNDMIEDVTHDITHVTEFEQFDSNDNKSYNKNEKKENDDTNANVNDMIEDVTSSSSWEYEIDNKKEQVSSSHNQNKSKPCRKRKRDCHNQEHNTISHHFSNSNNTDNKNEIINGNNSTSEMPVSELSQYCEKNELETQNGKNKRKFCNEKKSDNANMNNENDEAMYEEPPKKRRRSVRQNANDDNENCNSFASKNQSNNHSNSNYNGDGRDNDNRSPQKSKKLKLETSQTEITVSIDFGKFKKAFNGLIGNREKWREKMMTNDENGNLLDGLSHVLSKVEANNENENENENKNSNEDNEEDALSMTRLKRKFNKENAVNMSIIGQFNLGFIICRIENDIFIIDQHATDEKYKFEYLIKNDIIKSQQLISKKQINCFLTARDEIAILENIDVFTKNGFKFEIENNDNDNENEIDNDMMQHRRKIYLTSLPCSLNHHKFDISDIQELASILADYGNDKHSIDDCLGIKVLRPTKAKKIFASRACRSAVMIGTALTRDKMRQIIDHMAILDQPWNCPHGRPTMRHLFDLSMLKKHFQKRGQTNVYGDFGFC